MIIMGLLVNEELTNEAFTTFRGRQNMVYGISGLLRLKAGIAVVRRPEIRFGRFKSGLFDSYTVKNRYDFEA